jgi:hypothetical protein
VFYRQAVRKTHTVMTAPSARTMGIEPVSERIYRVAADANSTATVGGKPVAVPGSVKLLFKDPGQLRLLIGILVAAACAQSRRPLDWSKLWQGFRCVVA